VGTLGEYRGREVVGIIRGVQVHIDRGQGWGWAHINQDQQVAFLREWGEVRSLEQCRGGSLVSPYFTQFGSDWIPLALLGPEMELAS